VFSLLNAVDMAQTVYFLRLGIESNPFAVFSPELWFLGKFVFTFLFPAGLYRLDVSLDWEQREGLRDFLRYLVVISYLSVLAATVFFFFVVSRNMTTLRRFG